MATDVLAAFTNEPPELSQAGRDERIEREAAARLAPDRTKQRDFFVADILDVMPKGDTATMEHPIYALRPGDKRIRHYEHNGNTLTVTPSVLGLATMHDKDVLLYCTGQVVEMINRGKQPQRTVRVTAFDLLATTNRGTGKTDYERLKAALDRLTGTRMRTNIPMGGVIDDDWFGLVESAKIRRDAATGRMLYLDITLSQWTYNAALALQVLTYNRDYFRLRGGLERRLYELARKHCGAQPSWRVSLELLREKSGSTSSLREFRRMVLELVESGHLPDYLMAFDAERDMVTFYANGPKGRLAEVKDMLSGRPHAPVEAHEKAHARKARKGR